MLKKVGIKEQQVLDEVINFLFHSGFSFRFFLS